MKAELRRAVNAIGRDREHGAGWLTLQSLQVLKNACLQSGASTPERFVAEIEEIVDVLLQIRPGMVSIANYAVQFRDEFTRTKPKTASALQRRGVEIVDRLTKYEKKAAASVARNGSKLIGQRSIVMTCSYSSAVCTALEMAKGKCRDFKVLVIESRHGRISYGEIIGARLKKAEIEYRIVPDAQVRWHVARADLVLIGADAVSLQGWLINGSPSLELATIAGRRRIPVHCLCEKPKIDARGFITAMRRPEPGFDMVPFGLITDFITESGAVSPDDVYDLSIGDLFRSGRAAGR